MHRPAKILVVLGAVAVLAGGCRSQEKSTGADEGDGPDFFSGYDIGNEQDYLESRKDRPGYRPDE